MSAFRRTIGAPAVGLLLLGCWAAAHGTEVIIKGLTQGSAIVSIDGELSVLREGETRAGVTLLRADNRGATLEFDGRRHTMGLDRSIAKTYRKPEPDRIARRGSPFLYRQQGEVAAGATSVLSVKLVDEQRASVALGVEYVYAGDYGDEVFLTVETLSSGRPTGNADMAPVKLRKGKHYVELLLGASEKAPVVYASDALQLTMHWSTNGERQGEIVNRVLPFDKYWAKVRVR